MSLSFVMAAAVPLLLALDLLWPAELTSTAAVGGIAAACLLRLCSFVTRPTALVLAAVDGEA